MRLRAIVSLSLILSAAAAATSHVEFSVTGKIMPSTCNFQTTGMDIPLKEVDVITFTGPGSVSPWEDGKLISKGCSSDIKEVLMTFQGDADADVNQLFKVSGGATGIAIELQSDTGLQAVPDNTTVMKWTPRKDGDSYDFRARYVQTGDRVTAGPAETSAIINLTYL